MASPLNDPLHRPDYTIPRRDIAMCQNEPRRTLADWMAQHLRERLDKFLVDKGTGNVVLNIKDGQVMKLVIEEHIKG